MALNLVITMFRIYLQININPIKPSTVSPKFEPLTAVEVHTLKKLYRTAYKFCRGSKTRVNAFLLRANDHLQNRSFETDNWINFNMSAARI
jgi:hypothetical protein